MPETGRRQFQKANLMIIIKYAKLAPFLMLFYDLLMIFLQNFYASLKSVKYTFIP